MVLHFGSYISCYDVSHILQIELEINGEVVDLHMKVDESGRGFFSKKRYSEVLLCSCSSFVPVVLCEK